MYNTWIDNYGIREKVETASKHLKIKIAHRLGISALCTIEPRKGDGSQRRLTKSDAKETGKLEMDAHAFWILHNGMPPGRETEIPTSTGRESNWLSTTGKEKPYVEVEIAKDKDHGEGLWRLKFDPEIFQFEEESCQRGIPRQKLIPIQNTFMEEDIDDDDSYV